MLHNIIFYFVYRSLNFYSHVLLINYRNCKNKQLFYLHKITETDFYQTSHNSRGMHYACFFYFCLFLLAVYYLSYTIKKNKILYFQY